MIHIIIHNNSSLGRRRRLQQERHAAAMRAVATIIAVTCFFSASYAIVSRPSSQRMYPLCCPYCSPAFL